MNLYVRMVCVSGGAHLPFPTAPARSVLSYLLLLLLPELVLRPEASASAPGLEGDVLQRTQGSPRRERHSRRYSVTSLLGLVRVRGLPVNVRVCRLQNG